MYAWCYIHYKNLLVQSLNDLKAYIMESGLSTPPMGDKADLFLTAMTYTPKKEETQKEETQKEDTQKRNMQRKRRKK